MPVLDAADPTHHDLVAAAVVRVLRTNGTTAAVEPLIAFLLAAYEADDRGGLWNAAMALGAIGDPRAIPTMIALIDHDGGYDTVYGVGHFGLAPLTGVQYDESRDGAWWRAWWERNRARYPAVAGLEIPRLALERAPARAAGGAGGGGDAISEPAPEQSLLAGGDPRKRYFLYGPRTGLRTGPADAGAADRRDGGPHPLLLVLPGGDGSADFRPFVTNIWREAAPDDMLVAQLVAPRWSAGQFDAVVWPTEGLGWDAARFTTEAFVEAVVDDVAARYDVDRERVWLLAWSSGGPAAYASLVRGPATGAFVAMSVFRPEHVGDLAGAAGTRVHILHSPGDFIAMDFPERARDMLAAAGATTRLETYSGGHGWHGDVFGMIRRGLDWLDEDREEP